MTVLDALAPWRAQVETLLGRHGASRIAHGARAPERLSAAMDHMLLAGGKRLRPLLALACGDAARGAHPADRLVALVGPACVALDLVHTYSLVHDDLPALDDDALRRGRPTVHVAFDEATAVLAGDGLLTDAFAQLARAEIGAARQVELLASAAGSAGMVGGQFDDLRLTRDLRTLPAIHLRKTAFLFSAAAEMGVVAVGGTDAHAAAARDYGIAFGLAFQIWDDVLDVSADPVRSGKGVGRDAKQDKQTFVTLLGADGARARAMEMVEQAIDSARPLGAPLLEQLARFAVERDH